MRTNGYALLRMTRVFMLSHFVSDYLFYLNSWTRFAVCIKSEITFAHNKLWRDEKKNNNNLFMCIAVDCRRANLLRFDIKKKK